MYLHEHSFIGREIDGYRIEEMLGHGGMGVVYKALDINLDKEVALKMIDPRLGNDKTFVRRFRSEARALARLSHRNIVFVYALRQTKLGLYIAMEYLEGKTLTEYLEDKGKVGWQEALPLIMQVLAALDYAHKQGVVHRDLKPRNLMLVESHKQVKIMDFGLAKIMTAKQKEMTRTQERAGTLYYMSPEQIKGLKNVDHRTDVFSMGLTLYEMLSGRLPFNKDKSEFKILKSIVEDDFPSPTAFNKTLPRELSRIVMKALEKDPDKRYQNAAEMLQAVNAFAAKGPVAPRPPRPWRQYGRYALYAGAAIALLVAIIWLVRSLGEPELERVDGDPGPLVRGRNASPPAAAALSQDVNRRTPPAGTAGAMTGALRLDSQPQGATVMIDGSAIDAPTTPTTLRNMEARAYEFILLLDGYLPDTSIVDLKAEETRTHVVPLKPAPTAPVHLTVTPEATLTVDDKARGSGQRQYTLSLPAGRHKITVTHPTYGTWERTVSLASEQPFTQHIDFEAFITVHLSAQDGSGAPLSGMIYIDGEPQGATGDTPMTLNVRTGVRTIEVRVPGYLQDYVLDERSGVRYGGKTLETNFDQHIAGTTLKVTLRK